MLKLIRKIALSFAMVSQRLLVVMVCGTVGILKANGRIWKEHRSLIGKYNIPKPCLLSIGPYMRGISVVTQVFHFLVPELDFLPLPQTLELPNPQNPNTLDLKPDRLP